MTATSESDTGRPLSFAEAHDSLRNAQKSARGAPAYSRWVNRPVGRILASAAYRLNMTPNQVTAVSALFTYSAILVVGIARPSSAMSILVALLLLIGYALDSADGQLARLTGLGRPSGEWLDHVIDMGKMCLIFGAMTLSWARFGVPGIPDQEWALAVPLLFLAVSVVAFFGWLLSDLLIRIARARTGALTPPPAGAPVLRSILRLPSDYGLLALTFAWFSSALFPITLTLLLIANAVILAAALPVWFSQVRASEEMP